MTTATLDANNLGANGASLALTTETLVTLYVINSSGTHNSHRVTLEFSPDGVNWFQAPHSINGHGSFMTEQAVASNVRACICKVEGAVSTVDVHILAR